MDTNDLLSILFTGIGEAHYDIDDADFGPLTPAQQEIVEVARETHLKLRAILRRP